MPPQSETRWTPRNRLKWPNGVVSAGKRAALHTILDDDETVLWTGSPDARSTLRTQTAMWWFGLPWIAGALVALFFDWIPKGWIFPVFAPGIALTVAPFLLAAYASGTVYAITNRRAIIRHNALGKQETVSVPFEDMDAKLEILPVRENVGHLYFASNMPTRLSNVDHTGKLAFRDLADAEDVAALLDRARKAS